MPFLVLRRIITITFRPFSCSSCFSSLPSILKSGLAPTLADLNRFLVSLFQNHRFEYAVRFVLQQSANLSELDRNGMLIEGFCANDDVEKTALLLKEWRRTEVPLPSSSFRSLICSLSNRGLIHEASEIINRSAFHSRLRSAFRSLLLKLGQSDTVEFIELVRLRLLDSDSKLDIFDCAVLIHRLCEEDRVYEALELCGFLKKKFVINIVIYNIIITVLCRHGCITEALRLFDSLEKTNLKPSEVTYGALIDALSKEGHFLQAETLLERMMGEGAPMSTRIHNSLIDNYCKFGKLDDALRLFSQLEQWDEFTVSSMINGYSRTGAVEEALSFFLEFSKKGLSPDMLGFMYLVRGLHSKGRMEEARRILIDMLGRQSVIQVMRRFDVEETLLLACNEGKVDEAIEILDGVLRVFFPVPRWKKVNKSSVYHLHSGGSKCSFDDLYSELELLCSKGMMDEADKLVREFMN